ncbi:polysaccharide deacetylase family protein [Desulfopila sp. IMCC35006]|uniref:polysaccharide deacetylase family protein n=1 Tax=Desulfopila sp. IMCC35006 TaxID=2569542 RepID=UPI0010AB5881|nr:polysaccharide deacetylase family protein [Desulfopila sp. IMCC35006]TKB23219.1 polysaccharide deacetylase family protein [Desulfopila sp. IMCC35006]
MKMPRIDRLLTLYFFHPFKRFIKNWQGLRIPILMYHSISNGDESGVHPYYRVNTSPEVFEQHMEYLYSKGYSVVGLDSLPLLFQEEKNKTLNQSRRYVVITFDDGFRDFYLQAFPVLKKYRFTATVFLVTEAIGIGSEKFKDKEFLKWSEVRALSNEGICFGSHTATHPQLKLLDNERVRKEIKYSTKEIENQLGKSPNSFSYPYKFPENDEVFTSFLEGLLIENHFKFGVSTRLGSTSLKDARYYMKRIPINSDDDINLFKAKIDGGYDWLYMPQYLFKIVRQRLS